LLKPIQTSYKRSATEDANALGFLHIVVKDEVLLYRAALGVYNLKMAYMVAAAGHMDPLSTRLSCELCKEWMNAIDDIPLTGDPSITNQPAATFSCLERKEDVPVLISL
jgi:IKI3 family